MTVAPVPVMPADPAPPETAPSGPPAPGFADALEAAQQDDRAPAKGVPAKPKDTAPDPNDVADLLAALVALAGTPATPPPADPTATTAPVDPNATPAPADPTTTVCAVPTGFPAPTAQTEGTAGVEVPLPAGDDHPAAKPLGATGAGVTPSAPATPADAPPPAVVPVAPTAPPSPNNEQNTDPATALLALAGTQPDATAARPATARPAAAVPTEIEHATPTAGGMAVAPRADAAAAAAPAAAASPDAPPAPAPPPADQLFGLMRPLQRAADGSYTLRMELRPPELGRVDLRVELRDGVLHATIHTEHAHAAEVVRNALDDLRARLDADGVRSGQFTVDNGAAQQRGRQDPALASDGDDDPAAAPVGMDVTNPTASEALLDVRI